MKKTLGFLLLASFVFIFSNCQRNYVPTPSPVDNGHAAVKKIGGRKVFAATALTYATSSTTMGYDTLSMYELNDSTIYFRNDTLHYKAYTVDTVHGTVTLSLSQYAATLNGNLNSATFTYYYGNDSVSYFYSTRLYPLFTSGYEVTMHSL